MKAGRLSEFLTPLRPEAVTNPDTGVTRRQWVEQPEIRAEFVKTTARAVMRGAELFEAVDAVYRIRYRHDVKSGWRVRDREGVLYDVEVEPDKANDLKLLKCSKVND